MRRKPTIIERPKSGKEDKYRKKGGLVASKWRIFRRFCFGSDEM